MLGHGKRRPAIQGIFRDLQSHAGGCQSAYAAVPGLCGTCPYPARMAPHRSARPAVAPAIAAARLARPRRAHALRSTVLDGFRSGRRTPGAGAGSGSAALSAAEALCTRALRRSEEHTSELQSLMRISDAVFCLKKKTEHTT